MTTPVAEVFKRDPWMVEMVRFDVEAVPMPVMLFPESVSLPVTLWPEIEPRVSVPMVPLVAKRLVDDARVAKELVEVELPRIVGCVSWYATDVVECARPTPEKKRAEVVEKALPVFCERK